MAHYTEKTTSEVPQSRLDNELRDNFSLMDLIESHIRHETDIALPEGEDYVTLFKSEATIEIPQVDYGSVSITIADTMATDVDIRNGEIVRWSDPKS